MLSLICLDSKAGDSFAYHMLRIHVTPPPVFLLSLSFLNIIILNKFSAKYAVVSIALIYKFPPSPSAFDVSGQFDSFALNRSQREREISFHLLAAAPTVSSVCFGQDRVSRVLKRQPHEIWYKAINITVPVPYLCGCWRPSPVRSV